MASLSVGPAISIWPPPPTLLTALASLHIHTQTYIQLSQAPSPSPHTLTLSASHTRKQAWVLRWSENIDLHKRMHCLVLFHHWPLQIHIRLLHIQYILCCMQFHMFSGKCIISCSMLCLDLKWLQTMLFSHDSHLEGVDHSMITPVRMLHWRGFSPQKHPHSFSWQWCCQ